MAQPNPLGSPDEYLALEREAPTKSEYLNGEIFAMGGASRRHNLISLSIAARLFDRLIDRPCEVYANNMRLRIAAAELYTYPDVVVVCGEPEFEDAELDILLNPTLLVEVLSKSTADYDRGAKFESYRTVPSLREVLLVAQDEIHVVHYVRQQDGTWVLSETRDPEGRIALSSIETEVSMAEVYAKVRFEDG